MTKQEKEQALLVMWLNHKYWNSCCDDEAIDWSNHSNKSLDSISEIADYVQWREKLKQVCTELSKLVGGRYYKDLPEIF